MGDFNKILTSIHQFKNEILADGSEAYFRGQESSSWPLLSSAHRYVNRIAQELGGDLPSKEKINILRREERTAFYKFKTAATPFLDQIQRSDWGYVFAMQHYGLPTRLLDWTTSFASALFFAFCGWQKDEDAALYALNPSKLNLDSFNSKGEVILDYDIKTSNIATGYHHPGIQTPEGLLPSVAVQPVYTNPRMVIQQARFVICGDDFTPLEERFPAAIRKFSLTPDMYSDIRRFLDLVGLDWSSYFPDTEGLARQFRDKEEFTLERIRRIRDSLHE